MTDELLDETELVPFCETRLSFHSPPPGKNYTRNEWRRSQNYTRNEWRRSKKIHSKRVEKTTKLHSKRVEKIGHAPNEWRRTQNFTRFECKIPGPHERYLEHIDTMPTESPMFFGLHPNAEIGFRTTQCNQLCEILMQLDAR